MGEIVAESGAEDPLPLSALQHYLYCPRQCALIHVERLWAENVATVEGRLLHERTDKPGASTRDGRQVVHSMPLRSLALGLAGVADVVEMVRDRRSWRPFPVEYKRGRPKTHRADEVQLCAQGLCLEEMLGVPVPAGALFYGKTRRRQDVTFDAELRALTVQIAGAVRTMLALDHTPAAIYDPKRCDACSLVELCRPKTMERPRKVGPWLARLIEDEA